MRIPKQARRQAKELFAACLVQGRLDAGRVRHAVRSVLEARPRGYLAILTHFRRLLRLEIARRTARVETAIPLPPDFRAGVERNLARIYGPGLETAFAEVADLVGGMRVRVGSDVYDGSLEGRLAALAGQFQSGS